MNPVSKKSFTKLVEPYHAGLARDWAHNIYDTIRCMHTHNKLCHVIWLPPTCNSAGEHCCSTWLRPYLPATALVFNHSLLDFRPQPQLSVLIRTPVLRCGRLAVLAKFVSGCPSPCLICRHISMAVARLFPHHCVTLGYIYSYKSEDVSKLMFNVHSVRL